MSFYGGMRWLSSGALLQNLFIVNGAPFTTRFRDEYAWAFTQPERARALSFLPYLEELPLRIQIGFDARSRASIGP